MSARAQTDPDTGEVRVVINGKAGKVLAWLKALQPFVIFVFGVIVIPIQIFHFGEHRTVDQHIVGAPKAIGDAIEKAHAAGQLPEADKRITVIESRLEGFRRDHDEIKQSIEAARRVAEANARELRKVSAVLEIIRDD